MNFFQTSGDLEQKKNGGKKRKRSHGGKKNWQRKMVNARSKLGHSGVWIIALFFLLGTMVSTSDIDI